MTVYVKVNDTTCVSKPNVKIKDIASIYCTNKDIEKEVKEKQIFRFQRHQVDRMISSILVLVEKIKEIDKELEVENMGSTDFIVYLKEKATENLWLYKIKVILISLTAFFGASFSIMAYNTDVGIEELFYHMYQLVMGESPKGPTILHVCYTIGLAIGIIVFFNHAGTFRLSKEPTPFQVQMKLYERDVNDSLIMEAGEGEEEKDVSS